MSSTTLVLLILLGIALTAIFVVGLVFAILKLVKSFGGGGFAALHQHFASPEMPADQLMTRQTVKIGSIVYKKCMDIGVFPNGLYLARGSRHILIPWREVRQLGQTMLYWSQIPLLTIGEPPIASIGIPMELGNAVRQTIDVNQVRQQTA